MSHLYFGAVAYRGTPTFTLPTDWISISEETSGNATAGAGGIASLITFYIIRGASTPDLVLLRTAGDVAIGGIVAYRNVLPVLPLDYQLGQYAGVKFINGDDRINHDCRKYGIAGCSRRKLSAGGRYHVSGSDRGHRKLGLRVGCYSTPTKHLASTFG